MGKAEKLLQRMRSNPKNDWTPENIKTLCTAYGLLIRQNATSHAVLTNSKGNHLTIPMHKPIKAIYIKQLITLIEEQDEI